MTLGIAGSRSAIAQEAVKMLPEGEEVWFGNGLSIDLTECDRYLFCTGYLAGKSIIDLPPSESRDTFQKNFLTVARACDFIIEEYDHARIVVLGSESGFSGSYDGTYGAMKAALHHYVTTKKLRTKDQMLVALAPHIIEDTAMTQRRVDLPELLERGKATRLGRWLTAREVAAEAIHLLYHASPSLSGQVIRMRAD